MLTETQRQTLAAGLRAETNPTAANYVANRMDVQIAKWCNTAGAQDAWNPAMTSKLLLEATTVAKFDNLSAGKRDAWRMLLDCCPLDMARNKIRAGVVDICGTTDSVAVLQACTRKASNGEAYLGGSSATEDTVTALKLSAPGLISIADVSAALNTY